MYKLIILDFDGTIGDTNQIIIDTLQTTLSILGLPKRSKEQCRRTIGLPLVESFRSMMPLSNEQNRQCVVTYHRLFHEKNKNYKVNVFPGVIEAIKKWHNDGILISLASSRGHATLAAFVSDLKLDNYIALVLGADDVKIAKPDPYPVLKTLKQLGVSAKDTLVVGDMSFDILMGKRAGCRTCGVTYGNGTVDELRLAGADIITDSLMKIDSMS